jgi:threonine-phosphate decarboxylase
LKIPLDQILATNGSTELIHLLPKLLGRHKEALILDPCFSEYERAFRLNQICTHSLNYDVEEMFQMDSGKVISRLRKRPEIEMLVLGHPNNPTGHVWDGDSLGRLVQYCESQEIILVVDETFIEFCDETVSVLKWVQDNPHLLVIRSMTKFFGLAGVRLGYGVMHPNLRARLKKYQIPWSVNTIAQEMGITALEDLDHAQRTRKMVREQRQFLFSKLEDLNGIRVFPSQANFLLFQLTGGHTETAHQLYMNLMKGGLLIRNCGNFGGLDKSYFRVAVRIEKENKILVSRINAQLGREY